MRIYWFFIWRNLYPLHPRMLCAKIVWNWISGSEDFLISSMYFCYFLIISPWKRVGPFIWRKLRSPSPKDDLCLVWLKLAQWFWRRRFLNFVNAFSLFLNYVPLEKCGALYLNRLESPFPRRCIVPSLVEIGSVVLERKIFLISSMYFRYFAIISPWKRAEPFIWKKPEFLSPNDALCQVWLKLAQWFWRRRFVNFVNVFSLFRNYLHLKKGGALHLNRLEPHSPKDALC